MFEFFGLQGAEAPAAAIMFSAGIAMCVAYYHSNWATRMARTKATYDALNNKQLDSDYLRARDMFIQARNTGTTGVGDAVANFVPVPDAPQDEMTIVAAVRLIMNDYELTFIAIEAKVLDAGFLKKWHKSTIIKDYNDTKSYVAWMRGQVGNDSLYEVFQKNAEAWEQEDKPKNSH